jgi:hypothetical protein
MRLKPFTPQLWNENKSQLIYIKSGQLINGFRYTDQYKQGDVLLTDIPCFIGGYDINQYTHKVLMWTINGECETYDPNERLMLEDKS